jgi:hypothetical protein
MENKLILPKPHLSWSQLSCWLSNPTRYRKEYFEAGAKLDTKYLRFGSGIHKMIEDGTYKTLLPDLVVYDKNEFEVRVDIGGVPILAYIDSYNSVENVFRDTKTGKIPWTKARVIKLGQMVFYATVLKKLTGKMPEYGHLDWIETKEHSKEITNDFWRDNEKQLSVTGRVVAFERQFDEREIEKMENLIVKVANEISEAYQAFLKEI